MDGTVLIADDDRTIRTVLSQALTRAGCKTHATASLATLERWVGEGLGDVVISDVIMPDGNGLDRLPALMRLRPGLPVIVISAQNTIMTALRAEEEKAWAYLPKPFDLPELLKSVARALARTAPAAPRTLPDEAPPLIGESPAMQALFRQIARARNLSLPVLITGESGVGKSHIARLLHQMSGRASEPCVTASAEDLHGVDAARLGGGTLILEDVGELPPEAQRRVVRLIDALPADGPRVIATLQGPPDQLRDDLLYRLSAVNLTPPPLRDRRDDIALHVAHELGAQGIEPEAMKALRAYDWPGNLRQLIQLLRGLAGASDPPVTLSQVQEALARHPAAPRVPHDQAEPLSAAIGRHLQRYFDLHGDTLPPPGLYARILREMEAPLIGVALDACHGNQLKCAELLGINRNTLRKKIGDLEIKVASRRKMM